MIDRYFAGDENGVVWRGNRGDGKRLFRDDQRRDHFDWRPLHVQCQFHKYNQYLEDQHDSERDFGQRRRGQQRDGHFAGQRFLSNDYARLGDAARWRSCRKLWICFVERFAE